MATVQLDYTVAQINNGLLKGLNQYVVVASTNGDYTTLGAAITANETNIFIKNGTYNETANIDITNNNTIIVGESKENTKIVFPVSNDGLRIYANYCVVTNLTLDTVTNSGDATLVLGDGQSAGSPDTSVGNNNVVDNCIIKGGGSTFCVYIAGASYTVGNATLTAFNNNDLQHNNKITNCYLSSTWSGDAFSYSLQKNGEFSNNYCVGGRIAFYMCRESECNNNTIIDSAAQGIFIAAPCQDNIISGNKIHSSTSSGMKIQNQLEHTPLIAGQGAFNNTICNNSLYGCSNSGFEVTGDLSFEVRGNIISNNSINDVDNHGIYLQDAYSNTIDGNTIKNARSDSGTYARGSGIYLVQRVTDNNITNNVILDERAYILHSAIANREDTTCTGNNISGNKINANNQERTIWIQSDNTNISNNFLTGGYYAGIYLNGADNCNVSGNICKNNTNQADSSYYEIWVNSNGTDNNINNNTIISDDTNRALQDIYLDSGSENCRARNNKAIGTDTIFYEQINYDPTGFIVDSQGSIDKTTATLSWDDASRTFTITPTGTNFSYMWRGIKYTKSGAESKQITTTDGVHWIYYVGDVLSETATFDFNLILGDTLVAAVYWNNTQSEAISFLEERHGCDMQNATHFQQHTSQGTYYDAGLELTGFNLGSGTLASDVQFNMGSGVIYDEDIDITVTEATPTAGCPVFYRIGASGIWTRAINTGYSAITTGTGRLAYNEWTGATWQLTEITNNDYVCYHIYATNDLNYPWFSIMGQDDYLNANAARLGANSEINSLQFGGFPSTEFVAVGTIIYQTSNTYSNAIKAKIVQNDLSTDWLDWRRRKINRQLLLEFV